MTNSLNLDDLKGVYASSIASGIKAKGFDLSFIYVPDAVACAGMFTQHKFPASSIVYTKKNQKKQLLKAVVINSGNANAATGEQGETNTKTIAKIAARYLKLKPFEVGVAATGIIGKQLPMQKIEKALPKLLANPRIKNSQALASGILTTDLVEKTVCISKKIGKKTITIAGVTKGSGMIAPNMATTLAYLVCNCDIKQDLLQQCFANAVEDSYNMMSVDTDTSTSDMMLCFATGQYKINTTNKDDLKAFQDLLTDACVDLAKQIAKDGEGASKLIEVTVINAASRRDARKLAKLVVDSPLVKTAIHGEDPNWGRIMMAIGKDPEIKLNPKKTSIAISDIQIFSKGEPISYNEQSIKKVLSQAEVGIIIDCGLSTATARAWGCDLTKGYIDINTDYN